jgi:hypothetical protein
LVVVFSGLHQSFQGPPVTEGQVLVFSVELVDFSIYPLSFIYFKAVLLGTHTASLYILGELPHLSLWNITLISEL